VSTRRPAGKLIAADLEVVDGRIAQVRVSGGASFPSRRHAGAHRRRGGRDGQPAARAVPDGTLERIGAAVAGRLATADVTATTAQAGARLGPDTILAVFAAGSVASASAAR
jgi:hypothetical protein